MIYMLSKDFRKGCVGLCDKHLNESILDTGMAISFYLWTYHPSTVAFDAAVFFTRPDTHTSIPRALYPMRSRKDLFDWIIQSPHNYTFLLQYMINLVEEYKFRFSSTHKLCAMLETLPKMDFGEIVSAGAIDLRIKGCQNVYKTALDSWTWTNRDKPSYVV